MRRAALALAAVLAMGCSSTINPDVARLGDGGGAGLDGSRPAGDGGACAAGQIVCGAICADPTTDRANCGGCGRMCRSGAACVSGTCACPPGDPACSTIGDPDRCGGATCRDDQVCASGSCECRPGLTMVGGSCLDLETDPRNCGAPGTTCPAAQVCAGGGCHGSCPPDLERCDGACVDLDVDPLHCGECGRTCERDRLCVDGGCRDYRGTPACDECRGDRSQCCDYAGGLVCVNSDSCP